jgi:phosphate/sulfate permease
MNNVGDFFRRVFGFLVSSPRRKFADKIGTFFGIVGIFITVAAVACALIKGGLVCAIGFIPFIPFTISKELLGGLTMFSINNESLYYTLCIVASFFIYYIIGYILGAMYFSAINFLGSAVKAEGENIAKKSQKRNDYE